MKAMRRFRGADYTPVATVPEGLTWKPFGGAVNKTHVVLLSLGNLYRLERNRETGEVAYFKHKDVDAPKSSAETIDAEPKKKDVRFRVGSRCWFVDTGPRWYLVEIVRRADNRITIKSVAPFDADKTAPWPYPEELEFVDNPKNPLLQRLRKLNARYV
jgi:hypothetical protein